ncbi:hypothetical protein D3C73_1170110 [compost metagenome]
MPRQPRPEQETVTLHPRIAANHQIVMGEVVARPAFKCQFAVLQLSIVTHIGGQACAGEMRGVVKADVMFDHLSLRITRNLKMMAVMDGIHFAFSAASTADMQQIQRPLCNFAGRHADNTGFLRQTFGQMQEYFGLDRLRQGL